MGKILSKRIVRWSLAFVCFIMLCGISTYNFLHLFDPPQAWQKPLLYPNAQQVEVRETDKQGPDWEERIQRVVTFKTRDGTEAVLSFYRDAMLRDGWQLSNGKSGELRFIKFIGTRSPAMYTFTVITEQAEDASIELQLGYEAGR